MGCCGSKPRAGDEILSAFSFNHLPTSQQPQSYEPEPVPDNERNIVPNTNRSNIYEYDNVQESTVSPQVSVYLEPVSQVQPRPPRNNLSSSVKAELLSAKTAMATPSRDFDKWQLNVDKIKILNQIGQGNFGKVHKAEYIDPSGNMVMVALKTLHTETRGSYEDQLEPRRLFIFEASILMEFRHPNILWLIGVCTKSEPWFMVSEFMEYGDLKSVLVKLKEKGQKLTPAELVNIDQHIAAGMLFLSSKQFVHRDLACRNCLVSVNSQIKIADFGMSRMVAAREDYYQASVDAALPFRWMSVEAMQQMKFTLRSDIWSFGVILWEIYTYGEIPYGKIHDLILQIKIEEGLRLEQPAECPQELYDMMMKCWNADAQERPDFYQLTTALNLIQARLQTSAPKLRDIGALANDVDPMDYSSVYQTRGEHIYQRFPDTGPGVPDSAVPVDTYQALEIDRTLYGDGLGGNSNIPGLVPTSSYYHGVCSRAVAERALLSSGVVSELNGTFLVRQSPRGPGQLVICMVFDSVVWHYKLTHLGDGRYRYYGLEFDSVQAVIDHHKHNPEKMLCTLQKECSRY